MQHINRSRWATKLLTLFADPNTTEEISGDLLEMYTYWVKTVGLPSAKWRDRCRMVDFRYICHPGRRNSITNRKFSNYQSSVDESKKS